METIKQERKEQLVSKFFQFSFRGQQPDREFFNSINNPVEYHFIASIYNWDDGTEVLDWIVNSPICDSGTAKMIASDAASVMT